MTTCATCIYRNLCTNTRDAEDEPCLSCEDGSEYEEDTDT